MSEDFDWYAIDAVLDADTDDWRELAARGGLTPKDLEAVLPALEDGAEQHESEALLEAYRSEVEQIVDEIAYDMPRAKLKVLRTLIVDEIWKLRVQPGDRLRATVEELVRQQSPPEPMLARR
jgi:hypothetical protein